MEPRLELRPLSREDVPALVARAHAQGRNVHPAEYDRFLDLEGAAGIALTQNGDLVGAVTLMRYFDRGFLGPVILGGMQESVGWSLVLATHAVELFQRAGVSPIEAEATEEEASYLERMGFARVRRTLVLEREPAPVAAPPLGRPMEARDLLDVGALDAGAVGFGRKEYLWRLRGEHPESARVVGDDEVAGFAFARRARRGWVLGPLVTRREDVELARALVESSLSPLATWPVVALLPEKSPLLGPLEDLGFRPVGSLWRLRAGPEEAKGDGATEWLVGGRVTG